MKKFLLPLLFVCFIGTLKAQVIANAGTNQRVCENTLVTLGGTPAANGGTAPYTYSWSPAGLVSNPGIANPTATINVGGLVFTLVVTDNLGATDTATVQYDIFPNPFLTILPNDTLVCLGQPVTFNSSVSQTDSPYVYTWTFGDGSGGSGNTQQHTYNSAGTYQVTLNVVDSNGCMDTKNIGMVVSQPVATAFSTNNVSCNGGSDGSIQVLVNGGIAPYTYFWNNFTTTQNQQNLPAGAYNVIVTDAQGCSASAMTIVNQPTALVGNATSVDESFTGACDGVVSLVVSGGVPPYVYVWNNSGTTQTITNLCPGAYNVTVVDANGCTAGVNGIVGSACPNNTLVVSITSQDLSCAHPEDTMTLNASGGTPPYSYQWSNGISSQSFINNVEGVYTGWVTDSLGCTKSVTDTINSTALNVSLQSAINASCNGAPDGKIKVTVTRGLPPYTYLWSNSSTADSITGIGAGSYTLTVTDANSCSVSFSYFLDQNTTNWTNYVYVSSVNANCANNGSATATVVGGTPPFTYLWSNGDTAAAIHALPAGSYSVTVSSADGCVRTGSTYVNGACYSQVNGFVFNDTNGNCIKDSGETGLSGISVVASNNNNNYYGYSANDGSYNIFVGSTGSYTVTAGNNWGAGCSSINICGGQSVSFANLGDTATVNIGFGSSSGYDLAIHPGWHSANPGFAKDYWVLYFQESIPAYTGPATIVFKYDSILLFQSNNNSGIHNSAAHTITWTVNSVPQGFWDWNTAPRANFTVPANTPVGYQLSQEFWITPNGNDCDTSDNHLLVTEPVTGSRDPNEKEVLPAGDILEEDSVLTYTIHFQNTGNDTTWFITIKDTLSPYLNPASVVNLASSHDYANFNISEKGILTWLFNPIFLVDSATNEPASKGFIKFKVKKRTNLPLSTQISNRASIYFDYNEPIVTNTVSSKLTEPTFVFTPSNNFPIGVIVAPNPFTQSTQLTVTGVTGAYDFELFDVSGKQLKQLNNITSPRFEINRDGISAGVYFYSVTTINKQKAYGRLVVN